MSNQSRVTETNTSPLARLIAALRARLNRFEKSGSAQFFAAATLPQCIVYIFIMIALFGAGEGVFDTSGHILGRDFINYWTASALVHDGRIMEIFDVRLFHAAQQQLLERDYPFHMWSYPPSAIFTVLPLGWLPYLGAFSLWVGTTLALYLFAARRLGATGLELAVLALAPATLINFFAGQNGFLTAGLLIMGVALLDRRPWLAGVMFGLLSFKPQLGLLIPVALLAARYWRPFLSAAATSIALFAASVAAFGWESWQAYLTKNAEAQASMLHGAEGAFVYWMPTGFMAGRVLGLDVTASYALQAALAIIAIAGVYWIYRTSTDRYLRPAALLAGTVLATPYLHVYDLTLLSLAVLWVGRCGHRDGYFAGERPLLIVALLLPILVFVMNAYGLPAGPLFMVALFALILVRAHGARTRAANAVAPTGD